MQSRSRGKFLAFLRKNYWKMFHVKQTQVQKKFPDFRPPSCSPLCTHINLFEFYDYIITAEQPKTVIK